MRKKLIIWGLFLLSAGAAAFGWGVWEQKKEKHLLQMQRDVPEYELVELKDLMNNKVETNSFNIFGKKRRQELAKYKTRIEFRELIFSISIVSVITGITILTYLPILYIIRRYSKHLLRRDKLSTDSSMNSRENTGKKSNEINADNVSSNCENSPIRFKCKEKLLSPNEPYSSHSPSTERPLEQMSQKIHETILSDYNEKTSRLEELLRSQAENMGQQAAELKEEVAQSVKQVALENSEPINSVLGELTQQISAIREYASNQQGRMEKLQDGYDWNIIKSFCLRIIRCIDNVERRIEASSKDDADATGYEEIRDELIFALESNGLEQFVPEIKSDYRQQEKYIEAVKDKEQVELPALKGKIAKVLRRGYRCIIDDENIKVVRTARVKLFG